MAPVLVDPNTVHSSCWHPALHTALIHVLATHAVEVIGKGKHEVTAKNVGAHILEIVIAGVTGDALVLIENVIDRQTDLGSLALHHEL